MSDATSWVRTWESRDKRLGNRSPIKAPVARNGGKFRWVRSMEGSVVPESAMESVGRTLANVKDMQTHLKDFLSLCDPQVIAQLPPLQRAQAHLTFAKATTTLFACILFFYLFNLSQFYFLGFGLGFYLNWCFAVNLRCKGVNPDDHPIKSELVCYLYSLW